MLKCACLSFQAGIRLGSCILGRAATLFFAFAISLSLMAPAQAARILAKQDRPLFRRAMMPLFSMGMDPTEHSIYALIKEKLKSIQEP